MNTGSNAGYHIMFEKGLSILAKGLTMSVIAGRYMTKDKWQYKASIRVHSCYDGVQVISCIMGLGKDSEI